MSDFFDTVDGHMIVGLAFIVGAIALKALHVDVPEEMVGALFTMGVLKVKDILREVGDDA